MISIVLATHNGASTLALTLDAFGSLESPESGYEIIVVDNNSSDGTMKLAERYKDKLPLTVVQETRQGRTHAMNRGVGEAKGDLVLVTDDDVIPAPEWLCAMEAAAQKYPDVSVFAGQIRHFWQKKPPKWLVELGEMGMAYGGTPIEQTEDDIAPTKVKGANFMVRKAVFGDFDFASSIGPDGSRNYAAGSETEFLIRLSSAGHRMIFVPSAMIRHIVRPHQVALKPVLARYFRIGRGLQATGVNTVTGNPRTAWGYPTYILRTALKSVFAALGHYLKFDSVAAVRELMYAATVMGRGYEWRQRNRPAE